jgi:hypothetical protein
MKEVAQIASEPVSCSTLPLAFRNGALFRSRYKRAGNLFLSDLMDPMTGAIAQKFPQLTRRHPSGFLFTQPAIVEQIS